MRARPLTTSRSSLRVFSLDRSLPITGTVRWRRSGSRRIAPVVNRTRPRSRWRALKRGNPTRAPAAACLGIRPVVEPRYQVGNPRGIGFLGRTAPPGRHLVLGLVPRLTKLVEVPGQRWDRRIGSARIEVGPSPGRAPSCRHNASPRTPARPALAVRGWLSPPRTQTRARPSHRGPRTSGGNPSLVVLDAEAGQSMAVLQVRHGAVAEPAVGRLWVHLLARAHSASFMPEYSHVRSIMDTLIFFGAVRCSAGPLGVAQWVWQGEPAGRPRSRFAGIEESPASTGQGAG
jgi:hypothetical protein